LRQRHGVGLLVHLENAEPPLQGRDDPSVVEVREDRGYALAPNPVSARFFNEVRSESNRAWCEEGATPWCQESAFSFSTLLV
jgi:hypothetical protein